MRSRRDFVLTGLALYLAALLPPGIALEAFADGAFTPSGEQVAVSPIIADGVLYIASYSRAEQAGHLRAIDISGSTSLQLWDAAEQMPAAGTGASPGNLASSDPPWIIDPENGYRSLFTNLGTRGGVSSQLFAATESVVLQTPLAVETGTEARALINSVRGRAEASPELVDGIGDVAHPLWGISRSTPAVAGRSFLAENAAQRDQTVYVGAEDGMLHAFHAGHWDPLLDRYNQGGSAAGRELWAYLPGFLLPWLKQQPFDREVGGIAVHVDGSPALGDFFLDQNGDGRRQWRSLLVGTGSVASLSRSVIFALDVTDPERPQVLWEQELPGSNSGFTKGAVIATSYDDAVSPKIFLTTAYADKLDRNGMPDPLNGGFGIQAQALDLLTGTLIWQWRSTYDEPIADINTTPAQPSMMDMDGDGLYEYLVFGDMAGRLWVIDAATGTAPGGGPAFTTEGGAAQPIGAGVAIHGRVAIFGTGGAEHADDQAGYFIQAVEIIPTGGQLLWTYFLDAGEKVWSTPAIDRLGRIYFAASAGYLPGDQEAGTLSRGRLIVLDKTGREEAALVTDSAVSGAVQVGPGLAVAVSLSGQVYQYGSVEGTAEAEESEAGPLRLFSWRLR